METAEYKASLSSDVIVASAPKSDPKEKSVMNELLKLLLILFYFLAVVDVMVFQTSTWLTDKRE